MENNNQNQKEKKLINYDKVLSVKCDTLWDFFNIWLKLIPTLKLREKELEIASRMLEVWYKLSKKYDDKQDLLTIFNSTKVREEIAEKCGINQSNFNVNLTNLKKTGFCYDVGDKNRSTAINNRYIPDFDESERSFCFILNFKINEGL